MFRGFVLNAGAYVSRVKCTHPIDIPEIVVANDDLHLCSDESFHIGDIPALIDLALMTGDREWFEKLQIELEWWKKSGEILGKK
jgi:hypothetical protein